MKHYAVPNDKVGCARAHAVNRWSVTMEAWVNPCEICG
jgi:hypothetical protein